MAVFRLAAFRGEYSEYRRLTCAKVESASFSDDDFEASPLQAESDRAPLLINANIGHTHLYDSLSHGEADHAVLEETVHCNIIKLSHHRKHVPVAFNQKPIKPRKGSVIIQLRIRKMDNTTFALAVPENSTLLELKRLLQKKFDSSGINISWPHVWGNFCLSFNKQKLLDNCKVLHQLGIGDCSEVHFVRHIDATSSRQRDCQRWRGLFSNILRRRQGLLM